MTARSESFDHLDMDPDESLFDEQLSRRALLGRSAAVGGTLAAGSLYAGGAATALGKGGHHRNWIPRIPASGNPLATREQRELEELAIRVSGTAGLQNAKQAVASRTRTIVGPGSISAEAQSRFNAFLDEWPMHYALLAAASDPDHPSVLGMFWAQPHEWFGMSVPGNRAGGGENVDNHYVIIPIDHGSHYEIRGRRFQPTPVDMPLSVIGNPAMTLVLGGLDLNRIKVRRDGTYKLTVGPRPANGNPNHVQTVPGAKYLFFRWTRSDWRQVPDGLRVRRLDPPRTRRWTEDQIAALAVPTMIEDVPATVWFLRVFAALPPNTIPPPTGAAGVGGLPSQSNSFARLQLADDEAFVFTIKPGGAAYFSAIMYDFWFRSIDYGQRQTSLNNGQSAPNPDGTITYVVSSEDPGVANWLDATGLHELTMLLRWQRVPSPPAPEGPPSVVSQKLVKFGDVDSAVPAGTPRLTPAERKQQLEERLATYLLRFRTS